MSIFSEFSSLFNARRGKPDSRSNSTSSSFANDQLSTKSRIAAMQQHKGANWMTGGQFDQNALRAKKGLKPNDTGAEAPSLRSGPSSNGS